MVSTTLINQALLDLLAADTGTIADPSSAPKIMLFKNNIVPAVDTVAGDLEEADFDGYAAIAATAGDQQTGIDPTTQEYVLTIKEPAGGWRWETTGTTNLPQTIYGFALVNNAKTTLYGAQLFDSPIVLQAINQEINAGKAQFREVLAPLS